MLGVSYALLRTKPVQTWTGQRIASFLAEELHTSISIGGIDIDLPGTIVLEKFYVADLQQDTLMYVRRLGVSYRNFKKNQNQLALGVISITGGKFFLKTYQNNQGNNLDFIAAYFSTTTSTDTSNSPFSLSVSNLVAQSSAFTYKNENDSIRTEGINFSDIDTRNVDFELTNIKVIGGAVKATIKSMSLLEKSGFKIKDLTAKVKVNDHQIEANQLHLVTNESDIRRYFSMKYDSWDSYADFWNKVRFYVNLDNAWVSANDIAYFASVFNSVRLSAHANGILSGPLARLESKDLKLDGQQSTYLHTSFKLKGLPNPDQFLMDVQVKDLHTNQTDLKPILSSIGIAPEAIPSQLTKLGEIYLKGSFTGYYYKFKTTADLRTDLGSITADGEMAIPRNHTLPEYSGFVSATDFNLGAILEQEEHIGKITAECQFTGKGFRLNNLYENAYLTISKFDLNHYVYQNAVINGTLDRKLFTGSVNIDDKNIALIFDGAIDLNQKIPAFNFTASIGNANLQALNLYDKPAVLHTGITMNLSASNWNNITGMMAIQNLKLKTDKKQYNLHEIALKADTLHGIQHLDVVSDLSDLSVAGKYDFPTIVSALKAVMKDYLPSYDFGKQNPFKEQDFNFLLTLKNTHPITELFYPSLSISGKNKIRGSFNSSEHRLQISGELMELRYDNLTLKDIIIDQENSDQRMDVNIACNQLLYKDSLLVNTINIANVIRNDQVAINVKLADYSAYNELDLNALYAFTGDQSSILRILPSELSIDHQPWFIKDAFNIVFNDHSIAVNDFSLSREAQELSINGLISNRAEDLLGIKFTNFNLESFSQVTKPLNIALAGVLNGEASISALLSKPRVSSKMFVNNLVYNKTEIGQIVAISSNWDQQSKQISFDGNVINNTLKTIDIYGKINTNTSTENLDINVSMNECELKLLEPFVHEILSNIAGTATADIKLTGSFAKPFINGTVKLNQAALTINYLNTRVNSNEQVQVVNNHVIINKLLITDAQNNRANATGTINLSKLTDPYFNISVSTDNFLCLNTGPQDNPLYYGTARATGTFAFIGPINSMKINIQASTNKGTQFYIPLSDANSIGEQNFINFVNKKDTSSKQQERIEKFTGIALNFDLDVTEDAQVQLIFDEKVGDIIKGRGNANLKLLINTLGDFEMYGEYEISEGEYLFTLQNLINKRLKVAKGGSIRWNGSPYEAQIDINAIYPTSAPVIGLYQAAEYRGNISKTDSSKRVSTDCQLIMKNSLFSPDLSFGLDFPRNPEVKTELAGYLSNQDNVNTQVLSLLIANRFTGNLNATGAASGGVEVLSNQVSNWLSSVYKGLNININSLYGAGGSFSFFDDRVIINGNLVTYGDQSSKTSTGLQQKATSVSGDVSAEYKINKNGNLRVKAFNKIVSNDLALSTEANQNVQGIGLLYRADFDSLGELWRRIWGIKPKETKLVNP